MAKESRITRSVREAIVRAADKGEDLSRKVFEATREALDEGLKKSEPQRDKIEKVAGDALKGFSKAIHDGKTRIHEFKEKAKKSEYENMESAGEDAARKTIQHSLLKILETGEKASEITRDAAMGVYLGVKDVLEKRTVPADEQKAPVKKSARKSTAKRKTKSAAAKTVKKTAKKTVKKVVKKKTTAKKKTAVKKKAVKKKAVKKKAVKK